MNKFVEKFMEKSKFERVAFIASIVSLLIVITFAVLQIFSVWNYAVIVCEIFMGISMISQAILQWKTNKGIAIYSLCVAVFIFSVAIFVLFIK